MPRRPLPPRSSAHLAAVIAALSCDSPSRLASDAGVADAGVTDAAAADAAAADGGTIGLAPLFEAAAPTTLPVPTAVGLPPVVGFSVNARVHPRGLPATWRVEYGRSTRYGASTAPRALPGKLVAHFAEDWAGGRNGWLAGIGSGQLRAEPTGGPDGGPFVRYTDDQGAGDDANHLDGIGIIHLGPYFYPGNYVWAEVPPFYLGGGFPDLRGARISMYLRGVNWRPNGTEIGSWIQAYRGP